MDPPSESSLRLKFDYECLLLRMPTFTFKEILYRVETCSGDFKTFRSTYFPEIFSMADLSSSPLSEYNNCVYRTYIEEHDKYILKLTDPVTY